MAGTGQTMQNMIKMIGLNFDSFESLALKAKRTPIVDDTCGVFTEAGISKLVSLGLPKEEIAAAIAYGFIGGYINKFVGSERFGEFISAQGGPFNNKACLAALALHTGREINAFPHRQLFGAYGAAIASHQRLHGDKK
jgi:activator of 2-hydroxyglutaryl-CoA dehydratase